MQIKDGRVWHGPLRVTELKNRLRKLAHEMDDCTDISSLDALLFSYQDELNQCQIEPTMKAWFDGATEKTLRLTATFMKEARENGHQ